MCKRLLLLALIVMLWPLAPRPVAAQPQQPDPRIKYGDRLYAEVVPGPSDSAGVARVDVLLRIAHDFMVFERDAASAPDSAFRGGVDVSVNLRKDGNSIGSINFGARAAAGDYLETERRDVFLLLHRTMYLEPGDYTALIVISDRGSTREHAITRAFRAVQFSEPGIGAPIVLVADSDGEPRRLYGYGGYLPFAERAVLAIPTDVNRDAEWNIVLERKNRGKEVVFSGTVQPSGTLRNMALARAGGVVERFELLPCNGCEGQYVLVELPLDSVETGPYTLRITVGQGETMDSVSLDTEVFWRDMPYSMRDMDFAIEAMRHILTKEQFEEMKDGDENYKRQKFRRFWDERDPTPGTAFNEMMTEYFRRVDQAYYKFQTLFEGNGITTDRGKVYILFGPPEDTQRILKSGEQAMEVWMYPSLSKTFRFIDKQGNGNFRLMED